MTQDQLRDMFVAQEAWDRAEQERDTLTKLTEAVSRLARQIALLNEALRK